MDDTREIEARVRALGEVARGEWRRASRALQAAEKKAGSAPSAADIERIRRLAVSAGRLAAMWRESEIEVAPTARKIDPPEPGGPRGR